MAYDLALAEKLKQKLIEIPVTEKKMFGGVAFLLNGNMLCGVHGDCMIARVGVEKYADSLLEPGAKPFDMTGRPMMGWVEVQPQGLMRDEDLRDWVNRSFEFVKTLPMK